MRVGILALQGGFALHARALDTLGAEPVEIRQPAHLAGIDALVMPGGESTTISMLLERTGLFAPIGALLDGGLPVLGTCAGMILLARRVLDGRSDQRCFGVLDLDVRRNAYGRQVDSFEADVAIDGLAGPPFHAVFIRAPRVERVGQDVEVLATVDDSPVLCRQGQALAAAFHPELSTDLRVHEVFLARARSRVAPAAHRQPTGGT